MADMASAPALSLNMGCGSPCVGSVSCSGRIVLASSSAPLCVRAKKSRISPIGGYLFGSATGVEPRAKLW